MSSIDPRTPVIVGQAVSTVRRDEQPGPEPMICWEEVCRSAAADAGLSNKDLTAIDMLGVVDCMSWRYDDPPGRLAERLNAAPRRRLYSEVGGTSGHSLLDKSIEAIKSGQADLALLCGAECLATLKTYLKAGEAAPWSFPHPKAEEHKFRWDEQHPDEVAIGLTADVGAVYSFAMRDIARRAHLGIAPEAYRRQLGELLSGMTRVAAANPHAWFPSAREPEFLITERADNRMVSYPYTKHMVAIIDVDMSGALIVASEEKANRLRVPREKRVYPWTSCYAEDPTHIAVREKLWKSEAMEVASQVALAAAGIAASELSYLDLYSCFTSAVNFARDALGVSHWPGDKITVTGGLPYAGGPGSSYALTSLSKLVEKLRRDPGTLGMASGVGRLMSHHAFGVYSTRPPGKEIRPVDEQTVQAKLDAIPRKRIEDNYAGPVTVATYTVMHDRAGEVSHGAAICDLPNGARAYARIVDKDLLVEAERAELVGKRFRMLKGNRIGELKGV